MGKQAREEREEYSTHAEQGQEIRDPGDLRKWRTELPNLYDDADLDPYAFRLLAHYKRVGNCFESVRTTAEKCKMSHATVIEKRDLLEGQGFIKTYQHESGSIGVEVVDVWEQNFSKYSAQKAKRDGGSHVEQVVATLNEGGSHVYTKKEPIKEVHTPDEPTTPKEECWKEVTDLFPMMLHGWDFQKWNTAWEKHPDKRRHDYAAGRSRRANPRRFKFYMDDFMGYDPDKAKTWGEGAPGKPSPKFPNPPRVDSRLRLRTD